MSDGRGYNGVFFFNYTKNSTKILDRCICILSVTIMKLTKPKVIASPKLEILCNNNAG